MKDHFLKRYPSLIERRCLLMPKLGRLMFLKERIQAITECCRMLEELTDRVPGNRIFQSRKTRPSWVAVQAIDSKVRPSFNENVLVTICYRQQCVHCTAVLHFSSR